METFKFNELSKKSQNKAIKDYIKGWKFTHDELLNENEVRDILKYDLVDDKYTKTGKLIESE